MSGHGYEAIVIGGGPNGLAAANRLVTPRPLCRHCND